MLKKFENLCDIKQILDINLKGTKLMKNMIDFKSTGMRELQVTTAKIKNRKKLKVASTEAIKHKIYFGWGKNSDPDCRPWLFI